MRALLQRVRHASVEVEGAVIGEVGPGFLILVCLVLLAWFLIVKPKLNLGINISHRSENIVKKVHNKQPYGFSAFSRMRGNKLL